jgi:DNA-binding response OmpR family regulator
MKARVLIVEDNLRTRESIALYLRHAGYAVDLAGTGPEALASAASRPPDLILLDLMLPGLGGLDVCRTLRARTDVPIIMVTARTTEEDTLEGLRSGADDYVSKPFSPRELVARVGTVLRRAGRTAKVIEAGIHPQYGKIVAIDHGNGLVSRYAHASEIYVTEGDLVVRGQKIAAVGTTGRSTGPHLHFEVRMNGVPQNPARFLRSSG